MQKKVVSLITSCFRSSDKSDNFEIMTIKMEGICAEFYDKIRHICENISHNRDDMIEPINITYIQYIDKIENEIYEGSHNRKLMERLKKIRDLYYDRIKTYTYKKYTFYPYDNTEITMINIFNEQKSNLVNELMVIQNSNQGRFEKYNEMLEYREKFNSHFYPQFIKRCSEVSERITTHLPLLFLKLQNHIDEIIHPYKINENDYIERLKSVSNEDNLTKLWKHDKCIIEKLVLDWRKAYPSCPDKDIMWNNIKSQLKKIYLHILAKRYHPDQCGRNLSEEEKVIFALMAEYIKSITRQLQVLFILGKNANGTESEVSNDTWWDEFFIEVVISQSEIKQEVAEQRTYLVSQSDVIDSIATEGNSNSHTIQQLSSQQTENVRLFEDVQKKMELGAEKLSTTRQIVKQLIEEARNEVFQDNLDYNLNDFSKIN